MDVSNCAAASDGLPNHTNDPLPDGQKREIQARISAELEDIRVIEEEIQDLRLRHKVKTDRVASLKIFVSPMKEFPHEVIARIFEQYAHGPYPDPDGGRRNPPWYLGHICSRWRTVAWATPNLWNFFVFDARNFKEGSLNHRSLDIAKYLLVRTGQSPISCIFLRPHSHPFSATRFFDLFSDHVGRLRSLKIDHINGIRSLYSIPQYPLTSLKFLDLRFDSIGQTSPHDCRTMSVPKPRPHSSITPRSFEMSQYLQNTIIQKIPTYYPFAYLGTSSPISTSPSLDFLHLLQSMSCYYCAPTSLCSASL